MVLRFPQSAGLRRALCDKAANPVGNLIAQLPEDDELLFSCAFRLGWIFEAPMQQCGSSWKDGTGFLCAVGHSNHVVKLLVKIRVDPFGNMVRNINVNLPHDRNGIGVEPDRMRPRTRDVKLIAT